MTVHGQYAQYSFGQDAYSNRSHPAFGQQSQANTMTIVNQKSSPQSIWDGLDNFYCKMDKGLLNTMSYIPLASSLGGALRISLASLQTVTGKVGFVFEGFLALVTQNSSHYQNAGTCFKHIVHGYLNASRGVFELPPMLINNLSCVLYDASIDNKNGGLLSYNTQSRPLNERVIVVVNNQNDFQQFAS